jgi:hypothetical protein
MTTTTYDANGTALLIVDPYNDFMSEGGKRTNEMRTKEKHMGKLEGKIALITGGNSG